MAMTKAALKRKHAKGAKTMHTLRTLVGLTTFIEQVTRKARPTYSNLPMMQKIQAAINNLTGNIIGINLFNGVPKFSQKINPAGMANKWTGIGLGMIIYGLVSKYSPIKLPQAGKVSSFGKPILFSGLAGGLFDDPPTGFSNATIPSQVTMFSQQTPSYISMSPIAISGSTKL